MQHTRPELCHVSVKERECVGTSGPEMFAEDWVLSHAQAICL